MEKALDQIEKALDQMAKTLCPLEKALDQVATTLRHLKKALGQMEKALDQVAKTRRHLKETRDQVAKMLCPLKKALDQVGKTLRQLEKALDQVGKTLRQLKKALDQMGKTLRQLNKAFDQMERAFDQMEKALDQMENPLCQKTNPLCKESKTLFSFSKPLCGMSGRNSSSNPPTYANRKTTVQPHHHHQHRRIAMVNTSKSAHRPTVALSLPKKVPALIVYAQGIVERMTGNPSFPTPTPTVAAIVAAIHDLQAAETAALARAKGSAAARNDKRKALIGLLQQVRAYIQATADADATNAVSVIQSAGVAVRKTPTRHARTFAAKPGRVSGEATVVATLAARRASYEWQYSIDGGKTWVTAPATLQAKTTVTGLVPGSTVQFKYRAVTKTGEGDWSQPVSLMVH